MGLGYSSCPDLLSLCSLSLFFPLPGPLGAILHDSLTSETPSGSRPKLESSSRTNVCASQVASPAEAHGKSSFSSGQTTHVSLEGCGHF